MQTQWFMLALHVVILIAAIGLARWVGDPKPNHPNQPGPCALVQSSDTLNKLSLRPTSELAFRQLEAWVKCDDTVISRARTAVDRDYWLIALITFGLALATFRASRHRTWRLASYFGGLATVVYAASDLAENAGLKKLLVDDPSKAHRYVWHSLAASMKFGALIAAIPLFLLSGALAIRGRTKSAVKPPSVVTRVKLCAKRLGERFTRAPKNDPHTESSDPKKGPLLGICSSGGGIRSAAFNLGAFQALDAPINDRSEYGDVEVITAVSGGSYLAAAFVSARERARNGIDVDGVAPWARRSFQEDHLRRNSSYLAQGMNGKVWAIARFLFGLLLNIGLIALALGVASLPYGWYTNLTDRVAAADGGVVQLPNGGCIQLSDGSNVVALPGTTLHRAGGDTRIDPTPGIQHPDTGSDSADATVSVAGKETVKAHATGSTASVSVAGANTAGSASSVGDASNATDAKKAASPSCTDPTPVPDSDTVNARLMNRRLESGDVVTLALRESHGKGGSDVDNTPVAVTQAHFFGCELPAQQAASCNTKVAQIYDARPGSRLLLGPGALLKLDHAAIVADHRSVAGRCGRQPCHNSRMPAAVRWIVIALAGLALLAGMSYVAVRTDRAQREIIERVMRWLVTASVLAAIFAWIVPWLIVFVGNTGGRLADDAQPLFGVGIGTILASLASYVAPLFGGSLANKDAQPGKVAKSAKSIGTKLRPLLIKFAGAIVGPVLVIGAALIMASAAAGQGLTAGQAAVWFALFVPLMIIGSGVNLNYWSLHTFYRDRLQFAFAPQRPPATSGENERKRWRAEPYDFDLTALPVPKAGPKLIVCAAANIADRRVTAPGRPVVPWVFSSEKVGSPEIGRALGNRGWSEPGEQPDRADELHSLWTAVAVSGAAFSPAMGKMTRPERMVMALANMRLGVWYPNPGRLADPEQSVYYDYHHPRPWYLLKEAVGAHRVTDQWVYVTDGGHYENLGLVEMLRTGCKEIYCFDASGDQPDTFGTFADAMRLAREELELSIDIDFTPFKPLSEKQPNEARRGVTAATVTFKNGDQGWIVVAKLCVPSNAPFDIRDLSRTLPSFPSHPTFDQLYTDQKFEAYRALGYFLGSEARALAGHIRANLATVGTPVKQAVDEAVAAL